MCSSLDLVVYVVLNPLVLLDLELVVSLDLNRLVSLDLGFVAYQQLVLVLMDLLPCRQEPDRQKAFSNPAGFLGCNLQESSLPPLCCFYS